MTFAESVSGAVGASYTSREVPAGVRALRQALIAQREYTLALYADLPPQYWVPGQFPVGATVNPPLWELAHIAWFQEFFALRWRADDVGGSRIASCLDVADRLFDSRSVAHQTRWHLDYPSKESCFDYLQRVLDHVLDALDKSADKDRYGFQLVLLHEDMHAEALAMTLTTLGLPLPAVAPLRSKLAAAAGTSPDIHLAGGMLRMGARAGTFGFDNEKPSYHLQIEPFDIAARVVSADEFAAFRASRAYRDPLMWSSEGNTWRERSGHINRHPASVGASTELAALHVNYFEAEAFCRAQHRRLPTEAEWECAATSSDQFLDSTGHVWEWTASPFAPYPGFQAERYREYSEPSFDAPGAPHQVLKGGSFVSHSRLKYPQYRNFYAPARSDMFCGFRTCAIS
ncbi:MAG: SUMF1/EgtB/PvdO family nonheme iron enzyme [Burkholderiales bacterium]|nr:SUMF1/EgtB/PvdO family nonheme iron enzyme [Burkholderiales bacterium]